MSLLYANSDSTVLLIDIPISLSIAQGTPDQPNTCRLYSSAALNQPRISLEPKSDTAKANMLRMLGPASVTVDEDAIMNGLEGMRIVHIGPWCYPRQVSPHLEVNLLESHRHEDSDKYGRYQSPIIISSLPGSDPFHIADVQSLVHRLVHNPCLSVQILSISSIPHGFRIPCNASFFLTDVTPLTLEAFSKSANKFYSTPTSSANIGQFDFVLLDPPWDNRSARRSRGYATRQAVDPMEVLEYRLEPHLAPCALVACWVTNKPSVRQAALKAFESWNVEFKAQWVWLKVTVNGDLVSDLRGTWRKPYECLLLGWKRGDEDPFHNIRKDTLRPRLLVGVPDFHSRKPSVKELIEPLMADSLSYRALEVFARNLTAGWWSLGNEVLRYNSEEHWFEAK